MRPTTWGGSRAPHSLSSRILSRIGSESNPGAGELGTLQAPKSTSQACPCMPSRTGVACAPHPPPVSGTNVACPPVTGRGEDAERCARTSRPCCSDDLTSGISVVLGRISLRHARTKPCHPGCTGPREPPRRGWGSTGWSSAPAPAGTHEPHCHGRPPNSSHAVGDGTSPGRTNGTWRDHRG